jgi:3-methylfumaryl-CoA hydratase
MTPRDAGALAARLRPWIGRESGPVRAPGPIEWSDVRRYVNATGDRNPLWGAADPETSPTRAGARAPPAMILDVLRPAPGQDQIDARGDRGFPSLAGLAGTIVVPGERGRLNAGTEIEWLRPLRIGDWVTVTCRITDVTVKEGRSGPAVFITEERRCTDQAGQPIAVVRQTTVRMLAGDER